MIFSDRDLRQLLADGRLLIEPLGEEAIQPSSIDLRVGYEFRVFANHRYPYIDVREPSQDLTEVTTASEEEPFVLHPGEFVLGSTLEKVTLPDDVVARLEGKSSLGRLGLLIHSSLPGSESVLVLQNGRLGPRPIEEVVRKRLDACVVGFDPESREVSYHPITGWYEGPPDRIFEVALASGRRVRVTAGHNLFTLDRDGELTKVRTGCLTPGTLVAIPGRIPDPENPLTRLDLLELAPESAYEQLLCAGPTVTAAFDAHDAAIASMLRDRGCQHLDYYRRVGRLPLVVAAQLPGLLDALGDEDGLTVKGSIRGLPPSIPADEDLAWLLGLYVAKGHHRRQQVTWSNADQPILDRVEQVLRRLGLPSSRSPDAVTCCSSLLSLVLDWLQVGSEARRKRVPPVAFGWPQPLVEAFLAGFINGGGSREATRWSLRSSSERLVGDLLVLAQRLGMLATACSRNGGTAYEVSLPVGERQLDGGLGWDRVVAVRDTGEVETIYDLEVRPAGRRIENFVAGYGGVFVSNTAGFVDAGWTGSLTLELSNVANLPITIYPGMKIGQLCLFQMTSPAERPYGSEGLGSKYQGQEGPTPSRYFENFGGLTGGA